MNLVDLDSWSFLDGIVDQLVLYVTPAVSFLVSYRL